MWDSVEKEQVGNLTAKIIQGLFSIYTNTYILKYFSLTVCQVAKTAAPFISLILAWFILNERTSCGRFALLTIACTGAFLVMFGAKPDIDSASSIQVESMLIPTVMLILSPLGPASGSILMRLLKRLSEMTVSCWTNFVSIPVMVIITYISGSDF